MNKESKMMMESPFRIKTVSVGDVYCGKTSLLSVICKEQFPQPNTIKVFQNYVSDFQVDGREVWLTPWDTASTSEDDRRRPFFYSDADVILICFSLDSPISFENVEKKWWLEIQQYCPEVSIVLIGTKKDLRDQDPSQILNPPQGDPIKSRDDSKTDGQGSFVTFEDGRAMADKIGAFDYLECSAKTKDGIHAIFPTAARAAFQARNKKIREKKCDLL